MTSKRRMRAESEWKAVKDKTIRYEDGQTEDYKLHLNINAVKYVINWEDQMQMMWMHYQMSNDPNKAEIKEDLGKLVKPLLYLMETLSKIYQELSAKEKGPKLKSRGSNNLVSLEWSKVTELVEAFDQTRSTTLDVKVSGTALEELGQLKDTLQKLCGKYHISKDRHKMKVKQELGEFSAAILHITGGLKKAQSELNNASRSEREVTEHDRDSMEKDEKNCMGKVTGEKVPIIAEIHDTKERDEEAMKKAQEEQKIKQQKLKRLAVQKSSDDGQIREAYLHLQSNEWHSAIEVMREENMSEQDKLALLCSMIKVAEEVAIEGYGQHMKQVEHTLLQGPCDFKSIEMKRKTEKVPRQNKPFANSVRTTGNLPEPLLEALNDLLITKVDIWDYSQLVQVAKERIGNASLLAHEEFESYITAIVKLSWKMILHTPPMKFDFSERSNEGPDELYLRSDQNGTEICVVFPQLLQDDKVIDKGKIYRYNMQPAHNLMIGQCSQ